MNPTFARRHLVFRESRFLPIESECFVGFKTLDVLGPKNWTWTTMFRPFFRISQTVGEPARRHAPDDFSLSEEKSSLRLMRCDAHSLKMMISLEEPARIFLGGPGEFANFGGNIEQEFLVFFGNQQLIETRELTRLVAENEGSLAEINSASGPWKTHGAGYYLDLPAGEHAFGVGLGFSGEEALVAKRAASALAVETEDLEKANRAFWRQRVQKLPEGLTDKACDKAEEAVWVMEGSRISSVGHLEKESLAAGKPAFARGSYLWDTCFGVRGYADIVPDSAKAWLENFVAHLLPSGKLPGSISADTVSKATQVPVFSWAANAVYDATGDKIFLEHAYHAALANHHWWMAQGDSACGDLPQCSVISYDNSPVYDFLRDKGMSTGKTVNPDIVAAVANDAAELKRMAEVLGDDSTARELTETHTFLSEGLHTQLWDPESEFYYSKVNGEWIKIKTGPALHAIAIAPQSVAAMLAERYICPGSLFWPRYGIATVAVDEASFDPENYWRGMIWGPTNRLTIDALDRAGQTEAANRLADATLSMMEADDAFYEVINPVTGKGCRGVHMSGFAAGVYLDLLRRRAEG